MAGDDFVKNIDEEKGTSTLQLRYLKGLKRMEGGVMSLERKGHSAGFDMVHGEGRFEVHELGKFFKNRMFVITFHALNVDARSHQCLIRMKKLLENARNSYLLFGFMGMTRIDSISPNFT